MCQKDCAGHCPAKQERTDQDHEPGTAKRPVRRQKRLEEGFVSGEVGICLGHAAIL
jgi:hypothetical protein